MNALLVYPKFPDTYWSFKHALKFIKKTAAFPPLGLVTVASMLPKEWEKRLVDLNIRPLSDSDIKWADYVFISAMIIQRESVMEVIKRIRKLGVKIVGGGPLFTTEPEQFTDVDYLVLNEAEITLAPFLQELEKGQAKHPNWHWVLAGIDEFHSAEPFDVMISCAALQWLHHHERLLPQLWGLVREGGALAAQMPANQESPLHRAVFRTAESERWSTLTGQSRAELNFQPPAEYFSILGPLASRLDVWETIYYHEMASLDDLLDWAKTTVMRPFFDKIPDAAKQADFVADVRSACVDAYPATNRGTILYVQKRLFFIAYKNT